MLQQVFINLLDNAGKFSPDGGCVAVSCEQKNGGTEFSFSNAYADMTDEMLAHIFDKFYQGDPSHAVKGNGLGLAIAQEIVKLHDGTITVSYDGKTITFTVRLLHPKNE